MGDHQVIVMISEAQKKAIEYTAVSLQGWVDNALHEKARHSMNLIIKEHTAYNPDRLTDEEKEQIVLDADIETAAQRQARHDAELEAGN